MSNHAEENLPSTSKCGSCDFTSDDNSDLIKHKETVHDSANHDLI